MSAAADANANAARSASHLDRDAEGLAKLDEPLEDDDLPSGHDAPSKVVGAGIVRSCRLAKREAGLGEGPSDMVR